MATKTAAANTITETVYTVARDTTAVSSYRATVAEATTDLAVIQNAMRTAGLEPDVALATVTKTTTYSAPTAYES